MNARRERAAPDQVGPNATPSEAIVPRSAQRVLSLIEERKAEFYLYYLERGGPRAWAFQLARHPEDAEVATATVSQELLATVREDLPDVLVVLQGQNEDESEIRQARELAAAVIRQILAERLGSEESATSPEPSSRQIPQIADLHLEAPPYPVA